MKIIQVTGLVSLALLALAGACAKTTEDSRSGAGAGASAGADSGARASGSEATPPVDVSGDSDAASSTNAGGGSTEASADAASHPASKDAAADAASTAIDSGAVGECAGALPLRCGDRLAHDTNQGRHHGWFYGCTARAESGPEMWYSFVHEQDCRVSVTLSDLETDLDLLAFDRCDQSTCVEVSSTPLDLQDGERVVLDGRTGHGQIIVVDGYSQSAGTYTIAADCLCGAAAQDLVEGSWRLQVNRRWNGNPGDVTSTTTPLEDADYVSVDDGVSYPVETENPLRAVLVGDERWLGKLGTGAVNTFHYELSEGTFAGGRFVIWTTSSGLEAELTLYGSGVPIASSERGPLVRNP